MTLLPRLALTLLCLAPLGAAAQTPGPSRVRGTVEKLEGETLTVRTATGAVVPVKLGEGWVAAGIDKAALADIRPGRFIATVAVPDAASGGMRAIEVLVTPPGVTFNEVHAPWDLLPQSTMTNATIAEVVTSPNGPVLTLPVKGQDKPLTLVIPPEAILITTAPATRADVKPGMPVFLSAQKQADGGLTAMRVTVGNHGIAPPM